MILVLGLILISALIHPIWNIILKQSSDKEVFYLHMHLVFTLLFSFVLFIFPLSMISPGVWLLIIVSSIMHLFYQIFLCRMYRSGDVSLAYPIARSSPIFVVLLGFFVLREIPSALGLLGIAVVIIGVHLINQERLSIDDFLRPLKKENRTVMLLAGFTAFFSALYSVVDKKAVLEMNPILFFYLFFAFSGLLFGAYLMFFKEKRENIVKVFVENKRLITVAGVLEFASYILILYAFRLSKVAYIVALRQISVVFAVIFGVVYLREKFRVTRLVGSLMIFIGVFLVTVFG